MAHNSSPARKGGQQPPFEIILDEGCSIVCDEVPVNCTIRVLPVDGRSPPRMSPVSQWMEDYPSRGTSEGGEDWGPQPRNKYGNVIGSPISSPPSPMRSRRSIVESVRRNIQENTGGASSSEGIPSGFGGSEDDIFALRKQYCKHESPSPSATPSFTSASSSATSSSREPSPPPAAEQRPTTDRLLNSNRPQMAFKRTNIQIDSTDLRELPSASEPQPTGGPPQPPPSSSRPSPPSPSRQTRCCAMADYNPADYRSNRPEKDQSKSPEPEPSKTPETDQSNPSQPPETDNSNPPQRDSRGAASDSVSSTGGGKCTYHEMLPCPARAGCRCRENRAGSDGAPPASPGMQGGRSCKYHNALPCPALAGVTCRSSIIAIDAASSSEVAPAPAGHLRSLGAPVAHLRFSVRTSSGEIQKSGASPSSTSRSPRPDLRPPRFPGADARSRSLPEIFPGSHGADVRSKSLPETNSRPGSPSKTGSSGGCAGVTYPPRTISPPPKSPRSKTPSRRPSQKWKGVCL